MISMSFRTHDKCMSLCLFTKSSSLNLFRKVSSDFSKDHVQLSRHSVGEKHREFNVKVELSLRRFTDI
jgi:hypothetical protein